MTITAEDLKQRLSVGEKLNIIDVREPYEFEETNIPTAINIPLGNVPMQIEELNHLKNEEVIMQCRSGARSAAAQQFFINAGFTNVKNLIGGILAYNAI
jgi:rhodanese-related sulfurtransferase